MPLADSKTTYRLGALAVLLSSLLACTGCQVSVGGQTLPSPYYVTDDVQYFPAGPEFELSNEAEAMRSYEEDAGVVDK